MTTSSVPTGRYAAPRSSTGQLATLRADLADAAYTVEHLTGLLGPVAGAALHREQPLPAVQATAGSSDPAAALARPLVLASPSCSRSHRPAGRADPPAAALPGRRGAAAPAGTISSDPSMTTARAIIVA